MTKDEALEIIEQCKGGNMDKFNLKKEFDVFLKEYKILFPSIEVDRDVAYWFFLAGGGVALEQARKVVALEQARKVLGERT